MSTLKIYITTYLQNGCKLWIHKHKGYGDTGSIIICFVSPEGSGDASTGPILLGTTLGLIIETELSSDERKWFTL